MSNQDGWDQAKDERIEAALQRDEATFAPHCPACLSANLIGYQKETWYRCLHCGLASGSGQIVYLCSLPSQPAPPYTDGELLHLAYAYGHDIWGNGGGAV